MGDAIRLQVFLARAGVSSRRGGEDLIRAGRVRVNGRTVREMGTRVLPGRDRVEVDGRQVEPKPSVWVALHKPEGYLTTRGDPHGGPTVYDLLPDDLAALFHVGRLDRDSEGLLLLTNDGPGAHRLLHPRFGVTKEYLAEVSGGVPDPAVLERLEGGIRLEDGTARAERAEVVAGKGGGPPRVRLVLREGRKREVRRMLAAVGHPVRRLIRVRFGPLALGSLAPGEWRRLGGAEERALRDAPGVDS